VLLSLLVSVFLAGFKMNALKEIVQIVQRRKELKGNISLLHTLLEPEDLATWLADVAHDEGRRGARVAAIDSAHQVYDEVEDSLLEQGRALFRRFDSSSGKATERKAASAQAHTLVRSETKVEQATGLLLGRTEVIIRGATPQQILAYILDLDGRHMQQTTTHNPANDVRSETVQAVNDHHTIIFLRKKQLGFSDRTFLNSVVAKKVSEAPTTFLVAAMPIRSHVKITLKDEAGALRAENCRVFLLTELALRVTRLDYCCSLNLRGRVPQWFTNAVAIPAQSECPSPFFSHPAAAAAAPTSTTSCARMLVQCRCRDRCNCTSSSSDR
jgi:hypothetical protein